MSEYSNAIKRLMKDRHQIESEPDYAKSFRIAPCMKHNFDENGEPTSEENMFHWEGCIYGPKDTPYHGGVFKIEVRFPTKYPIEPPSIVFRPSIFHPNIGENGVPCLSILRRKPDGEWTATWTLGKTLLAVQSLLSTPNPSDPLNPEAANLYKNDINAFNAKARASFTPK